ncbi:tripartite tricarboxylate transporter substrate binding protein [Roseomonas sp. AR75]|uniref:Bug family tripartite tricarboxylate transporter substrate binding protein n=1 Tax=Roseomonas sp. AR75 TaxID=2562311 RepID=UPI0010BF8077|nr:tripartite tricarboxylate transporter substrate binding protein [Roseomonas sp. AR75]
MTQSRRSLLMATGAALFAQRAQAQGSFPDRPVRLVIPFPPGGPTDLMGRFLGQRLAAYWGQPVVIDNRAGASGTLGSNIVARAAPDGYTLVFSNNATHGAIEQLSPRNTPYRTLTDFTPIALIGIAPLIMIARASLPVDDAKGFVALARQQPGRLTYASAAFGSAPHLASELLKLATGIDIIHVPFNGAAPATQALISDNVDMYMGGASTVRPLIQSGRAKPLGVVYAERLRSWPDLPTLAEQGIANVAYDSWYGLLGPAGMPAPLLAQISAAVRHVMDGEEVRRQLEVYGLERKVGAPEELTEVIRHEMARTAEVIRAADLRVE